MTQSEAMCVNTDGRSAPGPNGDEPPDSTLAVSHDGAHCLIEAGGNLDAGSVADLDKAITEAAQEGYREMIVVDLRRLTSFDQSALGMLVSQHYALQAAGGRLVVMHPPERMRQLIAHNRLDDVLDIRGTATGEAP